MAVVQEQQCQVRCNSMPSVSHPIVCRVEEELHKLKACVASSSLSVEMMCHGLRELGDLYSCINELLRLPSNQQVLSHLPQEKWLEEELDGSIRLLDLCGAVRDGLATKKEHLQDLQSALRRRCAEAVKEKTYTYISSGEKANKDIKNCLRSLKKMDSKSGSSMTINKDCDLPLVVRVLMKAREITISLIQSITFYLSVSRPKAKTSRWSSVSKAFHKKKVACEGERDDTSDFSRMLFSLYASYGCISCKDVDKEKAVRAQNQLQTLNVNFDCLENGLDCLFRQLIQSRVSLLNILSL
ncbi:uncharacterized protein [Elaeis guineensis]|uniref:Uncharacterized protein LOC109506471 n=1 Tax=Elaeis guineensis var. tenera TaxID=51953 RepID=A0A6J0PPU7_ELAGV|nr:uncharacterized protein LOC109506471 [Elaeis guineensis]